jgi:hypothetical protein
MWMSLSAIFKERSVLAGRTHAPAGRHLASDGCDVGCASIVVRAQLTQKVSLTQQVAERGEHLVGGRDGIALRELGAQRSDMLIAQRGPIQGKRGGLPVSEEAGQAVQRLGHDPPRAHTQPRQVKACGLAISRKLLAEGQRQGRRGMISDMSMLLGAQRYLVGKDLLIRWDRGVYHRCWLYLR